MRKPRENYTPVDKVAVLRRHPIDRAPPVPHGGQEALSRPSPNPVRDSRSSPHAALRHPETMKMVLSTVS
jgi:hypothetical protein